jgi:hypothetical protein
MSRALVIERVARLLCEFEGRDPDEIVQGEGAAAGEQWLGWQAFETQAVRILAVIPDSGRST